MNDHDDLLGQVRDSFSGLHMDIPVEHVFARGRTRRYRRISGLTAAATATVGATAAITLTLAGTAPGAAPAGASQQPASSPPVTLAAFSVTSGPGPSTTLALRKGQQLDPDAVRQALARHGIPALVTVGIFCRTAPTVSGGLPKVVHPSTSADGSQQTVIDGQSMPPGTRLSIGYFPNYVRMALITDGAPLSCSSTSHQPAAHIPPSGKQIHK